MKRSSIFSVFMFAFLFKAFGQLPQYHAQVFGEDLGIGSDLINEIFIDSREFVWIATNSALQRFDGRNIKRFPFNEIVTHSICADDGRIWVLSGFSIWRNREDWKGFEQIPFDTSGRTYVRGIFQVKGQAVMALTLNGIYQWDEKQNSFIASDRKLPRVGTRHSGSRLANCGNVLFYPIRRGVCAYNLETGEARTLSFKNEFAHLFAVTPDLAVLTDYLENSYWFDFKCMEVRFIDAVHYGLHPDLHKTSVLGFAPDPGKGFIVNTKFGLCSYDIEKDRFVLKNIYAGGRPLESSQVLRRIFVDNHGIYWAHTLNNIYSISPLDNSIGLLRNYHFTAPYQWNNRTMGITEDAQGNLWFGGSNGFKKLDLKTGTMKAFTHTEDATDKLSHPSVRGLSSDDKYIILGPTFSGMWLFDPIKETYRRPVYTRDSVKIRIEGEFIDHISRLRNGDQIVCGRFYMYRLKAKTYELDFLHFNGDKSNMNIAHQDKLGRIWIGTERGVFCMDEQYNLIPGYRALNTDAITSILQIDTNSLIVGTAKGLRWIKIVADTLQSGIVDGPLKSTGLALIFQDSLQRFWMGSYDGLYLADKDLSSFIKFDFSDNIQSYYFNIATCLRASNGMLFMGGQNGINYFYPERMERKERPLTVAIQSLRINDGDSTLLWPQGKLEFPHNMNTLTFEIVAPYYNNAGRLQYRYRIEQGSWVETGNTFRLPKIAPDEYRLEIAASITGQLWYESQQALEFSILPPFWQTWMFRLIATIAVVILLLGMIRYFEKRERKRQESNLEFEKLKNTNLQYQLETEQIVNYFSHSMGSKNTTDEILWDIVEQCIAHLGWEDCVIYLTDPERNVLVQKAAWGQKSSSDQKIVSPLEIKIGQGIVGHVAQTGKAELIEDTSKDPRYIKDDAERYSEIAVPILSDNRVIGVIDSENSKKNYYTPWHLQILTAIAALCSQKIALAKSEEARHNALLQVVDNQRKAAESKLQSLRLQMNPHFLFNALNSIQQMNMTGNGDGAALYLSKFSKLLRMVLTHSDHDNISLREELEMLQLYVELESLRFDDTFTYSISCEQGLDKEEFRIPPLLIQPFVENAIWHGLLQKDGKRNLKVHFETNVNDDLVCLIEDNGIGRKASHAFNHTNQRTGKGLSVSEERLQTINRQLNQNNQLEIKDLYYENGDSAGTRIKITLG